MVGMETLGLRMSKQCENALSLAKWFQEKHPEFQVNYPGLATSPFHEIAKKLFHGGFGAVITIRVGSQERAFKLIDGLKLAYVVSNIGDTKTLVLHPASTITLHNTQEEREKSGVYDDLIRISVGIEDIEDLIEDFDSAISALAQ